ncbi:hypothetical protein RIF29_14355 [Crotalaria pallida]|uniref:Uncharacterized protein n=1 Tax=Crotalaria pallida TaxID=3830 RepID=A0AAN9FDQ5_CROPI
MTKVVEVVAVAPSSKLLPTQTLLPLTFFDTLWLRLPPVERVFFYELPHPTQHFFDEVLPKLKESLAIVLGYFYPLAGHLTWPVDSNKPIIKYNTGDTVSLTVAESDAHFNHLAGTDLCEATEIRHLVPQLTVSNELANVLSLQVTLFPDSGFSIGITSHHAVLDGKTSTSFIKSWAYLCNRLGESPCSLPPELRPFYDRDVIKDPNGFDAKYASDWLKEGGPNNKSLKVWDLQVPEGAIRGVFHLSRKNIEMLKKLVLAKQKTKVKLHLSTLVVSLAYSSLCKVKAEGIKDKKIELALNIDCRSRLEPPIPPTYFGNCVGARFASMETGELLGEDGLFIAVEAISAALETLKDGVLSGAESWSSKLHDGLGTGVKIIGAAGSPWFEVYSSDFGWGRPKKVEMTSIDRTGAYCLSDTRDGDGIEIGFVSSKGGMEAFSSLFAKGLEY